MPQICLPSAKLDLVPPVLGRTNGLELSMSHAEKQELSTAIAQAFRNSTAEWHDFLQKSDDELRWNIINSFAYALNSEPLEVLTGRIIDQASSEMEFAGLTANHVIYFRGIVDKSGPAWQIFRRNTLSLVEVLAAPHVLTTPSMHFQYQTPKFRLSYDNGSQFELPMTRPANELSEDFIASLWADLDAA